ncbi:MAG: PEP/pyruvate-binding domain-containing protein [Chloroflexota bacterium]
MFVTLLADIHKTQIAEAGGKGANLGALYRGGLPVPPGFVVTTEAYRRFVEVNALQKWIVTLAAQTQIGNPQSYEATSKQIRDLFITGAMPHELEETIRTAYDELATTAPKNDQIAVAVRSSATAEDLPQASFAGQQETLLNVCGADALLSAIKECWASLWTARAMAYRQQIGIDSATVGMAVVIQTMVSADVSGILFTANPTTGERDEMVINASFGLGEAIVSGAVTPDTYVLDRANLTTKEVTPGTKEVMIVAADGQRTRTQNVPAPQRNTLALSDDMLKELATLGEQTEQLFNGVPQDIEWAIADEQCWLLQARPITNLPPAPLRDVRWDPPTPGTIWMRRQVVEHMPEPLSPLFEELYVQEGLDLSIDKLIAFMGDLSNTNNLIQEFMREAMPGSFATTVNGYAYSMASFNFTWKSIVQVLHMYVKLLPPMFREGVPHWREQSLPTYLATIMQWKEFERTTASDAELVSGIRELAHADAIYWFASAIPLGIARVTDGLLDGFLTFVTRHNSSNGSRLTSGPFLRGFPSKAFEAQIQLETIVQCISASGSLHALVRTTPAAHLLDALSQHPDGQPILDDLQQYLEQFGHQIYNLDFAVPTQADEPLPVLLSLKAAVEHPDHDARIHQEKLARERDSLVQSTTQSLNPLQRRLFQMLLSWAQRYTPYREEALFYVGAAWPTLRRLALELGQRLTVAGSLNEPDDVFYLKSTELLAASVARSDGQACSELAQLAQERRELREARKRLDPPVAVPPGAHLEFGPFKLSLFEPQTNGANEGPTLKGFAVSPGQTIAPASVIHSPADFEQMAPDTILVCRTTTPAWTPLFSQAKGLVTDIGGALAHGSIVAREYGIPAVMGTGVATQRITSGQRIQVDGDTGTVILLDEVTSAEHSQPAEKAPSARNPLKRKFLLTLGVGLVIGFVVWWKKRKQRMTSASNNF